jgi:hypothetical protein
LIIINESKKKEPEEKEIGAPNPKEEKFFGSDSRDYARKG